GKLPPRRIFPGRKTSEGPFETRTSIGRRCKHGNMLSRAVLIAREAWPVQHTRPCSSQHTHLRDAPALDTTLTSRTECHTRSAAAACAEHRAVAGNHRARDTPVPIPNTVVKPRRADGTAGEIRWESTSLPAAHLFERRSWSLSGPRAFFVYRRERRQRTGSGSGTPPHPSRSRRYFPPLP